MLDALKTIPILSVITYLPLAGALLIILFTRKEQTKVIKTLATFFTGVTFLLSLPLWTLYDWKATGLDIFQFTERISWIPSLGVDYFFAMDGISLLLILLTTLLSFISVYCSFTAITKREKEYYAFLLMLETGMLGVFLSMDFFLFYVFWEIMLVPMYFLIGIWGGPRKLYAAIKFFIYTLLGSVLMLLGILALYFYNTTGFFGIEGLGNAPSFDVLQFHKIAPMIPAGMQWWIFLAFGIAFAIKVPMFPFHTWLPDAHVEAPTAGSVILAGVLLKMGTYGFVRFSLPILPKATWELLPVGVFLAIVGIIYGALVAMAQKDMKKLVAYSSVSHLGFVMLGIFALNPAGITGGTLQMINHGISTGALFLLVGIVYERRHTRMISDYGGLSKVMPVYAIIFMIITLSSIGLPAMNGFVGEFTILLGAFDRSWVWALFAATGIVLGAAYMLWMYQRVFFGEVTHKENEGLQDLSLREKWTLYPLIILVFWIGLYPKPFLERLENSVKYIVKIVDSGFYQLPEHEMKMEAPVSKEPASEESHGDEH
ncbi:MAG TPA: NADH-quinone oxidoreductase subunit M [Thermoanaerobaculia bacterium]|nr:NADH-quinone oxidoreductase subunit M [Thermoanaerobaculia bacterium]HUM29544.1 NADH-quinone oxidoreductase subunit M [Thermoanaerobaculia bacterium]HXK67927.1 NADH-quinone oxidoreductase subunit M [Thermoanaerobaculia bacterium]